MDRSLELFELVRNNDVGNIKLLLESGADPNVRDSHNSTPLHKAVSKRYKYINLELLTLLIEYGADINAKDDEGLQPLHYMFNKSYSSIPEKNYEKIIEIIKLLIPGTDFSVPISRNNKLLLHLAIISENEEIVKLFLDNGADINIKNKNGDTPLISAIGTLLPIFEIIKLLLERGADVNLPDNSGNTALHITDDVKIARLLIENGANINAMNNEGITVLYNAYRRKYIDIVKLLLENGANVNTVIDDGETLLHNASYEGNFDMVKLLLEYDANVNIYNNDNNTALHINICKYWNDIDLESTKDIIKLLLDAGAETTSDIENYELYKNI